MAYRRKAPVDFGRDVLAQYEDLADLDGDDAEPEIVEEEEVGAVQAEGANEEEVVGVSRKRPKMTPDVVVAKLDAFLGPKFRGLSEIKSPEQWLAKLLRLYEEWSDSVFPGVAFEQFLKRLEKMSSAVVVKNGLWDLCRKRSRMDEQEEEQLDDAAAAAAGAVVPEFPELEERAPEPPAQQQQVAASAREEESDELVLIFDE